jgi:hypothetical protein
VCTVTAPGSVTTAAPGTCTITASQTGNRHFEAAPDVAQSFQVSQSPQAPGPQAITFGPLAAEPVGVTFGVSAAASSGLAVAFSSGTPGVCTVTAPGSVTTAAPGTCTITASQTGNSAFAAAPAVTQSFQVGRGSRTPGGQAIAFGPLAGEPVGATFTVSATASSGLAVAFSSGTPGVCTVTAPGSVTTAAPGTCTITASQTGNRHFEAAPDVAQSFQVVVPSPTHSRGTLLIILLAIAVLVTTAALLARRQWRVRSHPRAGPGSGVRAVPGSDPPESVSVRVTETGPTHTVRIEPAPGTAVITIEETRP